jgi:hypothetical protein
MARAMTRRVASLAVLFLLVPSCGGGGPDLQPAAPVPEGAFSPIIGLEVVAARQAVIDFLQDYTGVWEDSSRIEIGVATLSMARWAHWQNVRFQASGSEFQAEVEVRDIQAQELVPVLDSVGIRFDLEASVTWTRTTDDGEAVEAVHDFSGPAVVVQRNVGDWLVGDVTLNGDAISSQFVQVGRERSRGDLEITLDSLLRILPDFGVFANVHVVNGTDETVVLDADSSGMKIDDRLHAAESVLPALRVRPGEELDTQLLFPPEPFNDIVEQVLVALELRMGSAGSPTQLFRWVLEEAPDPAIDNPGAGGPDTEGTG